MLKDTSVWLKAAATNFTTFPSNQKPDFQAMIAGSLAGVQSVPATLYNLEPRKFLFVQYRYRDWI